MTDTSGSAGAGGFESPTAHALAQPPPTNAMRANAAKERRATATDGLLSLNI
jgi:hypothetical protein